MPQAVVLLSGGLDSATALYWAVKIKKWKPRGLIFDYGQRHKRELVSARAVARTVNCHLEQVSFSLPWGGSSLLDKSSRLPRRAAHQMSRGPLPSTYVPARNTIFLSLALSWADALNIPNIVIGANALDYSGYPDCRPRYYAAFQKVAKLGTRLGTEKKTQIKIWTPLIRLSKADIIRRGLAWGVPYKKTWSCYAGGARPCGLCDSCVLRAAGFAAIGAPDPALTAQR